MAKLFFPYFTILFLQQIQLIENILLPVQQNVNTIISNILQQYTDYGVIIHFDNITSQKTYTFLENLQVTLLINYDKENFYNRPNGYKFLHVVFLTNPFNFGQFSEIPFNLEFYDIILILSQEDFDNTIIDIELQFWQQKGLDRAGSVFVFNIKTNNLYHECFYCGYMSGILQNINNKQIQNHFNYFSNFYGEHFKIGYMQYLPFFWNEGFSENYTTLGGPEGKLLEILSSKLNFKYFLEDFEGRLEGEWQAMINAIHHRKLDWAVGGISASTERAELVDMTKTIHTEMYRVLFYCCTSSNNWHQSWQQVTLPFQLWLWFCIFIMLIMTTMLLKIINDYFSINSSKSILTFLEMTIRGLIDQPLSRITGKYMTGRFLLIAWWIFAIIIATAYRSKLASTLIHPYYKQPNSIQDLLENGYTFQVNNEDWSVLKENFERSADPVYLEILKKSNNHLSICNSIQYGMKNKVAVIEEETNLQYEVITNCAALLTIEEFSHLRLVAQEVFPSEHVWPLQLGAPYRRKFSMVIETLFASGIISHWYKLASKKQLLSSRHYNDIESISSPLSISTMFAPVLILFLGLVLAIIIFVCEIICFSMHIVDDSS